MSPHLSHIVVALTTVAGVLAVILVPDHNAVSAGMLASIGVLSSAFVAVYAWRSNWRSTAAGRNIMRLMLCIAAIAAHGTANALTDAGYWGREYIRPLLLLGVAVTILNLLLRLVWMQRDKNVEGSEWHP
ncbi:hypothetical protein IU448_15300 [Nocardia flavorosea]|uniref:putative phage holin n=1 Tax=Nocardia flavorosea TaxID=53429 RepID=UPI001895071C|nr:hypothetical protein [Nocardia flavorosea]MBF6350372.1 hypothetical protein [Nocardia flavorosea]